MIKAITFDLDNTLLDFMRMKRLASDHAARAMIKAGLKMPLKKAKEDLFKTYLKDIDGNTAFERFLGKNRQFSEKILAAGINAYAKSKERNLKPYPDVKGTLRKLKGKGMKLAIISDAPRLKLYQRLQKVKLDSFFEIVIGFEDTHRKKPSVLPFRKALKLLKVKPSEALHVGDWPEKDIMGAKRAGLKTAFARYGYTWQGKVVYADYRVKRFRDLLQLLSDGKQFMVRKKRIKLEEEKELLQKIQDQKWRPAKTYAKTAPHEYFLEEENKPLFSLLTKYISLYGRKEIFLLNGRKWEYTYFYLGGYRYWRIEEVMNRTRLKNVGRRDGVSYPRI